MPKPEVILSTDIAGILGGVPLQELYEGVLGPSQSRNGIPVELIAWWQAATWILSHPDNKVNVRGFHSSSGRSVNFQSFVYGISDLLLIPPEVISGIGGEKTSDPPYILVHEAALDLPLSDRQIEMIQTMKNPFIIENSARKGSWQRSKSLLRELAKLGISSGIMIDLAHLAKEINGGYDYCSSEFPEIWKAVLFEVRREVASLAGLESEKFKPFFGMHLPVGTFIEDSLLVDVLGDDQWRDFAAAIGSDYLKYIVFENQQRRGEKGSPIYCSLPAKEIKAINARNRVVIGNILRILSECGIIDLPNLTEK